MTKGSAKKLKEWNRKRALILGVPGHTYQEQIDLLKAAGIDVDLFTTVPELYQALSGGDSGAVFISSFMAATPAGKMAPDFFHRRFGVPVVIFADQETEVSKDWGMATVPDEIVIVESNAGHDMLEILSNWETKVEEKRSRRLEKKDHPDAMGQLDLTKLLADLGDMIRSDQQVHQPSELSLYSVAIPNSEGRGTFLFSFPVMPEVERSTCMDLFLDLIQKHVGQEVQAKLLIEVADHLLLERIRGQADKTLLGLIRGVEIMLAYIADLPQDQSLQEAPIAGNSWLVPLEDWWDQIPLPCKAALWMEKNQRKVLYVHPGRRLLAESKRRLRNAGVSHLCVTNEEFERFRDYRDLIQWVQLEQGQELAA